MDIIDTRWISHTRNEYIINWIKIDIPKDEYIIKWIKIDITKDEYKMN